jgi:DNA-directed RNA polymerase sigma subunit (sigma70/sigma32)
MNLGDIGTRYGLSRERIRQIQSGALSKLRQPVRALPLAKFVDDEDDVMER